MTPRKSGSFSSDDNPFDVPENYYGVLTNPATASKNSKYGRTRTYSVFEKKSSNWLDDHDDVVDHPIMEQYSKESTPVPMSNSNSNSSSNSTARNSGTSTPDVISPPLVNDSIKSGSLAESFTNTNPPSTTFVRKNSIVPLYQDDFSADSLSDNDPNKELPKLSHKFHHYHPFRRTSVDDSILRPKKFYINNVELTLQELLRNEDTDHNFQITIDDTGPKVLKLGTANSNGFRQSTIRGTYMLLNLLQELTIAKRFGRNQLILDEDRLRENPVNRMKRLIETQFWKNLSRRITPDNIVDMAKDTKIVEEYYDDDGNLIKNKESIRIYVPHDREDQFNYFKAIKEKNPDITLDIQLLPEKIDAEFIKSINKKPGLLSLASHPDPHDPNNLINEPYVVPGGRFNELYGWDSYMIVIGLLISVTADKQNNLELSKGMTESFIYEINHYGKILNANRSYYLGRSQPPFLTDMALRVFNKLVEVQPENLTEHLEFLKRSVLAAITEHQTVWCCKPRLDEKTGLSCYHPEGVGIPPETEASHFDSILKPYLEKHNVSQVEFIEKYNNNEISEPALDEYFLHDRAVRESGHDTSYRLEGKAAYLATVDLNSLLYKYETDIAYIIDSFFGGKLQNDKFDRVDTSDKWFKLAEQRKERISKYLWNEKDSIFYDYNVKTGQQTGYESATCFWPLWSKVATTDQADKLVANSLSKFEEAGGLVSGTLKSRGPITLNRPSRQWDYPYGWAPQQILAWTGLCNYGYDGVARRLVYRWLFMMIRAFVDYNGVIVEKYNVLKGAVPHKVDAEYGNQGADFKGVATEGFGWVNSSFIFGLTFLDVQAQRNLGTLTPPDVFLENLHENQRALYQ